MFRTGGGSRIGIRTMAVALGAALAVVAVSTRQPPARPLSAVGTASTEVGGKWVKAEKTTSYDGGKWIDITYGRPRLRYRPNIFGTGSEYGKAILAGAPIWRAGANVSTRLETEAALMIGGRPVTRAPTASSSTRRTGPGRSSCRRGRRRRS
jgi:hypothetical protein